MQTSPPRPPRMAHPARRSDVADRAESVATHYRNLVLAVGLQILLACGARGFAGAVSGGTGADGIALLVSFAALAGALGVAVFAAVTAYRLAVALGEGLPWLWAVFLFVPCVSILALLLLSSKANAWCKAHGVKVGLLGPTRESIEDLRRRAG